MKMLGKDLASSHNLIFLHGWGTDASVWKNQVEYFSKKYRIATPVIARPEGPKPALPAGRQSFFWDCFVAPAELLAMTDETILIGWSYGGMLAIEMAAKDPKEFKALVLVGCSAKFSDGISPAIVKNIKRNLDRTFEAAMRNCYGTFFSDKEKIFIDGFIKQQALPEKENAVQILDRLLIIDLRDLLKNIDMPTLIIHGGEDGICPVNGGIYLHENIKGSKMAVIKNAGHMPFYTRPDEFNKILKGFLETID